jgi:hypothetical protein
VAKLRGGSDAMEARLRCRCWRRGAAIWPCRALASVLQAASAISVAGAVPLKLVIPELTHHLPGLRAARLTSARIYLAQRTRQPLGSLAFEFKLLRLRSDGWRAKREYGRGK